VNSTLEKAAQALAESSIAHSNISRLLLVGGSSRIPMIAERLEQRFNITPANWLDPDLSVAMGASIQAAIASDQYFERSVVDICPHTLGIATLGDEDQLGLDGLPTDIEHQHPLTFAPLIRRNSRLPADFVRTFYKLSEFQEGVVIPVYQGEHSNTRQNDFIGEFNVELHNRASNELDIRFCYDINGTIKISEAERGNSQPTVYSMDSSRSVEQNSDSEFSGQLTAINGASVAEPELAVSNYLVEKVSSRLSQLSESAPTEIATLLEQYKKLLELDNEEGIDEIEDTLYEWLEAE
jgi:molecular chaperone DnaK